MREAELLKEIQQISVMAKNKTVNRAKLHSLKQGKGEPVRVFAGRVQSLASACGYNSSCRGCQMTCSYAVEVIMDQIIFGLADLQIRRNILSKPDETYLHLEQLIMYVEGKESGSPALDLRSFESRNTKNNSPSGKEKPKERNMQFCANIHTPGKKTSGNWTELWQLLKEKSAGQNIAVHQELPKSDN